ncbi:MAG: hypothetical protein AAF035_06950 [Pseudomonadota bacterium]
MLPHHWVRCSYWRYSDGCDLALEHPDGLHLTIAYCHRTFKTNSASYQYRSRQMQLDPNKRYLLSRPCGGFNDALVQLEKSRLYAVQYSRILILDMSRSGLHQQLDRYFTTREDFGCEIIHWRDDMAEALDAATSVKPHALRHRISSYTVKYNREIKTRCDKETGTPVLFDHGKDHSEHVLVYEQSGGGFASFQLLQRLTLQPDIAETILSRIEALDPGYDAVHIRHSDYKTNFAKFLSNLRSVLKNRRVLICSDSATAKDTAQKILHPSTTVLSVSDTPDMKGKPLHRSLGLDWDSVNTDMLTDLFALAASDSLFFSRLSKEHRTSVTVSGFSLLSDLLHHNRDVVKDLFSALETERVARVFDEKPENIPWLRRYHLLMVYLWNFEAKRKAALRNKQASPRRPKPENLPPKMR